MIFLLEMILAFSSPIIRFSSESSCRWSVAFTCEHADARMKGYWLRKMHQ